MHDQKVATTGKSLSKVSKPKYQKKRERRSVAPRMMMASLSCPSPVRPAKVLASDQVSHQACGLSLMI